MLNLKKKAKKKIPKSLVKDIKTMVSSMPRVYFMFNGKMVRVNHKSRILTAFKQDSYKGIQDYTDKVTHAYEIARAKKRVPLFYA